MNRHRPPRLYAVPSDDRRRMAERRRLRLIDQPNPEAGVHTSVATEDGIDVTNCIVCDGEHRTDWDRIKVDVARTWADKLTIFVAWFPCPRKPGPDLQHWLHDGEFAEAVEGGAELTEKAEREAAVVRFSRWLDHPQSMPGSAGWNAGGEGGNGPEEAA